jgi:carbamoyltransferase
MRTDMDVLVLGKYIFYKEEQPEWNETEDWRNIYVLV